MEKTTILPNRTLDENKQAAIKYFYTPGFGIGIYLIILLPITFGLALGGPLFGLFPGLFAGIGITLLLLLLRKNKTNRNINRATYAYEHGDQKTLIFTGITRNYGIKLNGEPQKVIALSIDGKPFEVRTFQQKVISAYTLPEQIAYIHPQYPRFIVPSGLFRLPSQPPKSKTLRNALILILPLAFAFGLTWLITSEMNAHSSTYAQPDALLYEQNGNLVLATVFTHFQANAIKNGTTYGTDSYYAEGLDLKTGKKLWKIDLKANNSAGYNSGEARLLGQSDRYLFFLRNELFIIDKTTGKLKARNKDLTGIKDKLPTQSLGDYMQDAGYTYNDSLHALVIKGNDGLFYTVDGNTLRTGTIDIADPETFFKNKFKYGNNYEDQIATLYNNGGQHLGLLDPKDTALLAHDANAYELRSPTESIRRTLYTIPSDSNDNNDNKWRSLNPAVFLFGGFLVDAGPRVLRTRDNGYVLMHKATIEPNATLLLTGLSANGQTRWTYSTGYLSIPLMFHETETNTLYIAGNNRGENGDHLEQVTAIDLATGATQQYKLQ